ncbi:MAG TPA: 4-oxalomesaconate tautomerase [Trebonia sp.]|nr:4-oxalomesaconate tautomerase [Trebonia sp.]
MTPTEPARPLAAAVPAGTVVPPETEPEFPGPTVPGPEAAGVAPPDAVPPEVAAQAVAEAEAIAEAAEPPPPSEGIPCMLMRGGTSKGAYFLAEDLPPAGRARDAALLGVMGSPDPRQIDGIGGAHPLTSKVAVVATSGQPGVDVDYLFLQVMVDEPVVTDRQNCGNILAGIGPFAVERGLVPAGHRARPGEADGTTRVLISMVNTGQLVTATFAAPGGRVRYDGGTAIDGVPGTAAPVVLDFSGAPGEPGRPAFPTGSVRDEIAGISVTCVDSGMPVVVVAAADLGRTGYEPVAELEADEELRARVQELRIAAGKAMGLGDVAGATVPKVSLVAPPAAGGAICTRTWIPARVHEAIGVLGAVSVAAAIVTPGAVGHDLAVLPDSSRLSVEHPTGAVGVEVELDATVTPPRVTRAGVVRTARKLFDGTVFPRS